MASHEGLVQPHVECIYCGFDLHGCELHGVCPDCGSPVGATMTASKRKDKRQREYDIDPKQIRKKAWMMAGIALILLALPFVMVMRACSRL